MLPQRCGKSPEEKKNSPKRKTTVSILLCSLNDNLRLREFSFPIKGSEISFLTFHQLECIREHMLFLSQ